MRCPQNHGVKVTAGGGYAATGFHFKPARGNRTQPEAPRKALAGRDAFLAGPPYASWLFPTRPIATENGDFLLPILFNTNHLTSVYQHRLCKRVLVVKRV